LKPILKIEFTYIIAYRHSEDRFKNLQLVLDWLGNSPRDIIIVESDRDSKLDCLKNKYRFTHTFLNNDHPFNKSWCFNVGYKLADTENIVFGDADLIMNKDIFLECVNLLNEYEVINPYRSVLDLTSEETKYYALEKKTSWLDTILRPGRGESDNQKVPFCGGIIIFKRSCLDRIGGWIEDFWGWGAEDDAQSYKVFTLETNYFQCKNRSYHLYHPRPMPNPKQYFNNIGTYVKLLKLDKIGLENYIAGVKDEIGDVNKLTR
jgi:hypothetical protein